jgi:hypothetical protein
MWQGTVSAAGCRSRLCSTAAVKLERLVYSRKVGEPSVHRHTSDGRLNDGNVSGWQQCCAVLSFECMLMWAVKGCMVALFATAAYRMEVRKQKHVGDAACIECATVASEMEGVQPLCSPLCHFADAEHR